MINTIILYSNQSDRKCVVKNLDEIQPITETFRIKEPSSIIKPVVVLSRSSVGGNWADINYAYIPAFKRFYFVDNIILSSGGIENPTQANNGKGGFITLEMSIDVLQTYQDKILKSQQEVVRSEYLNSKMYVDTELPLQANKLLTLDQIGLFPEASGNNYVLTTAGGS